MSSEVDAAVFALLRRFGEVDEDKLKQELQQIDEGHLLETGAFVTPDGQVKIHLISVMEGMLSMALGQQTDIIMPEDISYIKDALILFLKLNNTKNYKFRKGDNAKAWASRVLDNLFFAISENRDLNIRDQLVLLRMSEDPKWQAAFSTALDIYLQATKEGMGQVREADKPAAAAAAKSFKTALETRRAKLPKLKYGNAMADMREISEYAVGQYLDGMNVNDSLGQNFVVDQLGLASGSGKGKFEAFLESNKITRDMFPTTVQELYQLVSREVRFEETEEEVSHAMYTLARQMGRQGEVEDMFKDFADAAFPLAAKLARMLSFEGLDTAQSGKLVTDWMRDSGMLKKVDDMDMRQHVESVIDRITRDELRNLNAFRTGRTESATLGEKELQEYATMRIKLLGLNAVNQKLLRVERTVGRQVARTQQFISRPGQEMMKDMTFGVEEFFRSLRGVFEEVFDIADKTRQSRMKQVADFNKKYGPLSTVSIVVPRNRRAPLMTWIETARVNLNEIPYHIYER